MSSVARKSARVETADHREYWRRGEEARHTCEKLQDRVFLAHAATTIPPLINLNRRSLERKPTRSPRSESMAMAHRHRHPDLLTLPNLLVTVW